MLSKTLLWSRVIYGLEAMATDTQTNARANRTGRRQWLSQARAFTDRYARELFRNRTVLFWSVAFPVGFYLLTITIFIDTSSIPAGVLPEVKASIAAGYGMFGAIVASLNSFGQQLAADFEADRYQQFRSLPLAPTADLAGRMVAGLGLSVTALVAAVVVAIGTGAEFALRSAASPVVILVAVITFAVVWMVVALLVSTVVRDTRYASTITVSLALLAYFLTGYNGTEPTAFQGPSFLLNLLPHTLATRLVTHHSVPTAAGRSPLAPPAVPDIGVGLGLLVAYGVGSLVVGALVLRRVVYKQEVLA